VARWFHESGIEAVTEMDWWDDTEVILRRTTGSEDGVSGQDPGFISAKV